jgi:hypothetical protein
MIGHTRLYDSAAPACFALQPNLMRHAGWETTFKDTRRDILAALTELPNCRADRPMPLGILGEDVGDHKCETTKSVARCGTRWNIPRRWCLYINSNSPAAYFE